MKASLCGPVLNTASGFHRDHWTNPLSPLPSPLSPSLYSGTERSCIVCYVGPLQWENQCLVNTLTVQIYTRVRDMQLMVQAWQVYMRFFWNAIYICFRISFGEKMNAACCFKNVQIYIHITSYLSIHLRCVIQPCLRTLTGIDRIDRIK